MKIVLTLLAFLVCITWGAAAGNLYPACGGPIITATAKAGTSATVRSLGVHTTLYLECLAFEVVSVPDASGKDNCLIEHQTNYPYRLAVVGTYADAQGTTVTDTYDIRDVVGGSITGVTLRSQQRSGFSVVFTNLSPNSACVLQLRALISMGADYNSPPIEAPSLVAADPPTIFGSNGAVTYFVVRYQSVARAASSTSDLFFLSEGTSSDCNGNRKYLDTHPQLPVNVALSEQDRERYVTRRYRFGADDVGPYVLCYATRGGSETVFMARVNVFAGNPSYYEIVDGMEADGSVRGGVPITIKFYGYDLDTRPNGDRAKFVLTSDACESGEPAAGVPLETDLGPADDYGPNTTYTLWTFRIRYGGIFRVCYRRKQANVWTEVPSIDDYGPGMDTTIAPEAEIPVPTDPVTKKNCDVAPSATADAPWKPYAGVRVTLSTSRAASNTRRDLADAFCVPRGAVAVERATHNAAGKAVLFISIDCEGTAEEGKPRVCSSLERYNYLAHLAQTAPKSFEHHGVAEWEVLAGILIGDDTVSASTTIGKGGVFFICLTIVAVAVSLAYAKVKYDERREYFVQFGMDDGDLEDMYETGAIPFTMGGESEDIYGYGDGDTDGHNGGRGSSGRGGGGRGIGRPASHIGNALIEIEE